mmetsp:Transcript_5622/g.12192  ORF Transcript_5622/g.12192 Transcript_5622/m.12192 type:complete len:620 (-) Transcript_5622:107-1966(-)
MKLIASQIDLFLHHARDLLHQLELPSKDEYIAAASTAIQDLRAASVSSWNLTYISFRPIFILLGILGHYLAIVLRMIAKHSVAHGWRAAKEGYFQLRTGTIWFVNFQRDLPLSAKYAELGALGLAITLWLLRRHVIKNRYAERIMGWYREKKRRALRRYQNFVGRIAKTSSFLAFLLPHVLYAVLVVGLKRIDPGVVTYLATKTYLCSFISFWHPLYLTFSVLRRLSHHLKDYKDGKASDENGKGAVKIVTPSILKKKRRQEAEIEELRVEVVDLLKYWVVYAILLGTVRTAKLLPFFGHVLNVTTDDVPKIPSRWSFSKKSSGLYSKLRLPGRIAEEITLLFLVWLRFMPSTTMAGEMKSSGSSMTASKSSGSGDLDKQRPVDILFAKLSPYVLSTMNSSAFLTKKALGDSSNEGSTFLSYAIQKLRSILDMAVLVRLISKGSQEWIITTIVESSALMPAVTTLLMPSYFTNFGVIYVSLVVPAGYTTTSCVHIRNASSKLETLMPKMDDGSRYLQFWLVHAAITLLLASFASLLAWLPLSTHATWLLWAYVQLESSTRKIYGWFESELGKKSLEDNVLVRSTARIIAALPSNVEDSSTNPVHADNVAAAEGDKSKVE